MVTFLFWNLNGKPLQNLVATAAQEQEVDILILAESDIPYAELIDALNTGRTRKYALTFSPSDRLLILTSFPHQSIKPVHDRGTISVRRVFPPIGVDIILVAVHLSSKMYQDSQDQALASTRIARIIEETEQQIGHTRTIIVGDLNMNPFEGGVAGAEALHAVMSKGVARRGGRVVGGENRNFFYNPMWSMLGDNSPGPPGTYYYSSSKQVEFFWNMFDQVLLRPELLPYFQEDALEILVKIGDASLLSDNDIPSKSVGSDHLPVLFRLNL